MHKYVATAYHNDGEGIETTEISAGSLEYAYDRAYFWAHAREMTLAHVIEVTPDDEIPVEFDF